MDFTGPRLPPYAEIQQLDPGRLAALPPLRVTILRNVVLDPIAPYLRYLGFLDGFRVETRFGEYDNIVQEAMGASPGLLDREVDCVVVFGHLDQLSPSLARGFAALDPAAVAVEVERVQDFVVAVLKGIRRQTAAMVLFAGFEPPVAPALGLLDGREREGQADLVHRLNRFVRDQLATYQSAYFLDLGACLARIGGGAYYDARNWHLARAPYALEGLRVIATDIARYLRALKGKAKKCLVLDCDGVLWGGTIGEDGLAGIKLGRSFPGSPYLEFQQEVLNLYHRGIVLALCSANEEGDVWEVFDRHPDMLLKREHIAAFRIDWRDKATNLREIADQLNLGLESFVFMDDSAFVVEMVRELLPAVTAIQLPPEKASEHRAVLASCGLFDTLAFTAEDRQRNQSYQAEAARRRMRAESGDLDSYLRSLEQRLEIRRADAFNIPRIAQLTQKTNQFNLTTRRYSAEDVARMAADDAFDVIALRHRDRFGDSGIVGVCILRYENGRVTIDTLLLSCRVLGRGVEDAFLSHCLGRARQRGGTVVVGEYLPTAKNAQVEEFYPRRGFEPDRTESDRKAYLMDLTVRSFGDPGLFEIASDFAEGRRNGPEPRPTSPPGGRQ
jgi:FkbH-like protein